MPAFLWVLSFVGTVAMLWVGGSIIVHGLHSLASMGLSTFSKSSATLRSAAFPPLPACWHGWQEPSLQLPSASS